MDRSVFDFTIDATSRKTIPCPFVVGKFGFYLSLIARYTIFVIVTHNFIVA
jgi:hypothetical protein